MRRKCQEHFPRRRIQRKPLVSDHSMHHGTCVMDVPWRMSGSLTPGGRENVPGIPSECATSNFTYLVRGPLISVTDPLFCIWVDGWYVGCKTLGGCFSMSSNSVDAFPALLIMQIYKNEQHCHTWLQNTGQTYYYMTITLVGVHCRKLKAYPQGWGMGCLLWAQVMFEGMN